MEHDQTITYDWNVTANTKIRPGPILFRLASPGSRRRTHRLQPPNIEPLLVTETHRIREEGVEPVQGRSPHHFLEIIFEERPRRIHWRHHRQPELALGPFGRDGIRQRPLNQDQQPVGVRVRADPHGVAGTCVWRPERYHTEFGAAWRWSRAVERCLGCCLMGERKSKTAQHLYPI